MKILRRYNFKDVSNFRDLGGYAVNDTAVEWKRLFRSSSLNKLTSDEFLYLENDLNVRTIIDLRNEQESELRSYITPEKILYINLPFETRDFDMESLCEKSLNDITSGKMYEYHKLVLGDTKRLCEIITTITDRLENGAVVFHCYAGKDRTGVVAAVIFYLLGVDKSDIIADYEVSYTYNEKTVNPEIRKVVGVEDLPSLHSEASKMDALLELFKEVDLQTLLYKNGLTTETVNKLNHSLIS